jgi:folate-binding protein YgfZ
MSESNLSSDAGVVYTSGVFLKFKDADEVDVCDFGGIGLIETFGEPQAEYAATHRGCGLFDMAHRGCLRIVGEDRHSFLGNLVSQKTFDAKLKTGMRAGETRPAFLLNLKGRVALEMLVCEAGEALWIETDRRAVSMLGALLERYRFSERAKIEVMKADVLGLFGSAAGAVLRDACGVDADAMIPAWEYKRASGRAASGEVARSEIASVSVSALESNLLGDRVVIVRDVLGFRLWVPSAASLRVWERLMQQFGGPDERQPAKRRLRPIGWAAYNARRIEAGIPLAGIDYELAEPSMPGRRKQAATGSAEADEGGVQIGGQGAAMGATLLPAETGLLESHVDFNKGCYLGQEVVARMHARGQLARRLVGLRMKDDALPIAGATIEDAAGLAIGIVTSSTISPVRGNEAIGIGLLKKPHFEAGRTVRIPAEGAMRDAEVVELGSMEK